MTQTRANKTERERAIQPIRSSTSEETRRIVYWWLNEHSCSLSHHLFALSKYRPEPTSVVSVVVTFLPHSLSCSHYCAAMPLLNRFFTRPGHTFVCSKITARCVLLVTNNGYEPFAEYFSSAMLKKIFIIPQAILS